MYLIRSCSGVSCFFGATAGVEIAGVEMACVPGEAEVCSACTVGGAVVEGLGGSFGFVALFLELPLPISNLNINDWFITIKFKLNYLKPFN